LPLIGDVCMVFEYQNPEALSTDLKLGPRV
jgi:hypothetical protein